MLLHAGLVRVESEHLVSHLDQGRRERRPEPAQPDDDDLASVFDLWAQSAQHRVKNFVSQ